MDITRMTDIIRCLLRNLPSEQLRKHLYLLILDEAIDAGWNEQRACLGIDPAFDAAANTVIVSVWFKGDPRDASAEPMATLMDTAKMLAIGGTGGGFVEGPRKGWCNFDFSVHKDKAEELEAALLAIDGVVAEGPEIEPPAAPEFEPPKFDGTVTLGGAAAAGQAGEVITLTTPQPPSFGHTNSYSQSSEVTGGESNDHPNSYTAPESDQA